MTDSELDALLDGAPGATLTLSDGERQLQVRFSRYELKHPHAWRAALRRALGYEPPVYDIDDHDQIIRVLFMLADAGDGAAEKSPRVLSRRVT